MTSPQENLQDLGSRTFFQPSSSLAALLALAANPDIDDSLVLFTTEQLAELLQCSVSWIQKTRIYEPSKLPLHIKVGNQVRYPLSNIRVWLKALLERKENHYE